MFRKLLPALIILLGIAGIATARNCHHFFAQPVAVQQVVAYPQVYYSVGQDLQTEALAEKVAAMVEKKLALRAAIKSEPEAVPSKYLAQNCGKCHSGPNAKAGLVYDGSPLKCSDVTKALRAIAADKMPKGVKIDVATKGGLMDELLELEVKPAAVAESAVPVPPATMPNPDLE